MPASLLRPGALPVLPLPAGLRLQVVHADDAAQAYLLAVLRRARGAFNVATDPVLRAERPRPRPRPRPGRRRCPPRLIRPVVDLAWRARVLASDAGWLDMAMGVPLMDTARVRTELGWAPRHGAEETLREMLTGIAGRDGTPSPTMRPLDRQFRDAGETGGRHRESPTPGDVMAAHVPIAHRRRPAGPVPVRPPHRRHRREQTGSSGWPRRTRTPPWGPSSPALADEITAAREALRAIIEALDLRQRPYRQAAAWVAERVGRLKLNGRVRTRSPLSPLLELELMRAAVNGQAGLWETLADLAPDLGLPRERFEELAERSRGFSARLERLHEMVRGEAFRTGDEVGAPSRRSPVDRLHRPECHSGRSHSGALAAARMAFWPRRPVSADSRRARTAAGPPPPPRAVAAPSRPPRAGPVRRSAGRGRGARPRVRGARAGSGSGTMATSSPS